ncbi:hypothetical protein [Gemella cuniculi]|uniref:hypothetical protein n=1 Tax=Gemella cuniculi TaxID=150240 RepID=UPI00047FE118|nr:hypothetical protein [Gemella cuniculi]
MAKQLYKNNKGFFSLTEMIAVLFIVSFIIIILSMNSVADYSKYKERLAVDELVSDIYRVQTTSLNDENVYIDFFSNDNEYVLYYNGRSIWKKLSQKGRIILNKGTVRLKYREGNLVSKANTVDVKFDNTSYRIIAHLDTGYITLDEI